MYRCCPQAVTKVLGTTRSIASIFTQNTL